MMIRNTHYKYSQAVSEVVLDATDPADIDCFSQWSHILIQESYIVDTLQKRYDVDGRAILTRVQTALARVAPRDTIGDLLLYYCTKYRFGSLADSVQQRISNASKKDGVILRLFLVNCSLVGGGIRGAYDPTGFLWSSAVPLEISEKDVEAALVRLGVVNPYYYSSIRHQHPAWEIPEHVHYVLRKALVNGSAFAIPQANPDTLRNVVQTTQSRKLLDQVKTWDYGWPTPEKRRQLIDELGGDDNFRKAVGDLVWAGALTLWHDDDKGEAFRITPEGMAALIED